MVDQQLLPPGTIRLCDGHFEVGCGRDTVLAVHELQPEGRKRMSARDFINGYQPKPGERVGA